MAFTVNETLNGIRSKCQTFYTQTNYTTQCNVLYYAATEQSSMHLILILCMRNTITHTYGPFHRLKHHQSYAYFAQTSQIPKKSEHFY